MSNITENISNIFKLNNHSMNENKIILSGKIKQNDFRLKIKLSHYEIVELSYEINIKYNDYTKIFPDITFNNNKLKELTINSNYVFSNCILTSNIKKINIMSYYLKDLSSTFVESIYSNYHIELFPKTIKIYILDLKKYEHETDQNVLSNLPDFLESLYIKNDYSNINLNNLPKKLINFCYKCTITIPNIDNLPTNIISIYLEGKDILGDLSNLPSSIKDLVIKLENYDDKIKNLLDNLPNLIESLDVKFNNNNKKNKLFTLNQNIKILKLDFGNKFNDNELINKMPKNIEELYLYNSIHQDITFNNILELKNLKILRLPENIKFLIIFEDIKKIGLKKLIVPNNLNIIFDYNLNIIKNNNFKKKDIFINNKKIIIDDIEIIYYYNYSHDYLIDKKNNQNLYFNHPVKELKYFNLF